MTDTIPNTTIDNSAALKALISQSKDQVRAALNRWLPAEDSKPETLHQAMRYSALSGGKYVRPLLVYATGKALGVDAKALDGPACAIELIHSYSLVHDDLPAMDDDELRRGKPTCHRAFDEATAVLVGDALQSLAFHILAVDTSIQTSAELRIKMIETLAHASGSCGMAGGQAIDLEADGKGTNFTLESLQYMHSQKTGALIRASVRLGALSAPNCDEALLTHLDQYATDIGLAFQIRDDILDIEASTDVLGKSQGADIARNKPTYPALLGMDGAKQKAQQLHESALENLATLGSEADSLRCISEYIVQRPN
ncbi:(2E,6E)-farnesyl diphosphate synthase [hydrothermal vent metagenome]|uniref:(2E,6E)-farnesyl diphosphate synthase n=1 Tax=hydrothermal vent metagenome TaxID=652676 RepID=A0A3B0ZQ90_9ZZZZ